MKLRTERVAGVVLLGLIAGLWAEVRAARFELNEVAAALCAEEPRPVGDVETDAVREQQGFMVSLKPRCVCGDQSEWSSQVWVTPDGRVHRTRELDHVSSLQWVIRSDGEVVLQRSAGEEGSYDFSWIAGRRVTVQLERFRDGAYVPVSNVATWIR